MCAQDFVGWLKEYIERISGSPSQMQWQIIVSQLERVEENPPGLKDTPGLDEV